MRIANAMALVGLLLASAAGAAGSEAYDLKDLPRNEAWYKDARIEVERVFGLLTDALRLSKDFTSPVKLIYPSTDILAAWAPGDKDPLPAVTFPPIILDSTRTEDELAFLLAHELAHVRFAHPRKRSKLGSEDAFALYKEKRAAEPAFAKLKDADRRKEFLVRELYPAFQKQENTADFWGVFYMHAAGFDCRKAAVVFTHFSEMDWALSGEGDLAVFKSYRESEAASHGSHGKRMREINRICEGLSD